MAANGKPGRTKVPVLTHFTMAGYSPKHDIPFHVVGMAEGRHYSVAIRRDQLDNLLDQLARGRDEFDAKVTAEASTTME